jgi:hypothetical protein
VDAFKLSLVRQRKQKHELGKRSKRKPSLPSGDSGAIKGTILTFEVVLAVADCEDWILRRDGHGYRLTGYLVLIGERANDRRSAELLI